MITKKEILMKKESKHTPTEIYQVTHKKSRIRRKDNATIKQS